MTDFKHGVWYPIAEANKTSGELIVISRSFGKGSHEYDFAVWDIWRKPSHGLCHADSGDTVDETWTEFSLLPKKGGNL